MLLKITFVAGMALLPVAAFAAAFQTTHSGALAQSFAFPALGEVRVLGPDERTTQWRFDLTNEYVADANARETLTVDGERAALSGRVRFGRDGWEWGLEVPLVHVGGGFLDRFIEDWHEAFQLPNAGRERAPQDRYRYRYERDGQVLLNATETGWALGDVRIEGGMAMGGSATLRAQIKLPTGDEERLSGGNLGGAVWADWALPFAPGSALSGFASAGISANDKGDLLPAQQRRYLPFGGAGLFYRPLERLSLGTQVSAQAPLYQDSELDALDRPSVQLTFGGRWHAAGWSADLAVQEDLVTESSPDFSIHLGLQLH